jgi:hypothetical protein
MPFPFHDVIFFPRAEGGTDGVLETRQSSSGRTNPQGKPEDDSGYDRVEVTRKKRGN